MKSMTTNKVHDPKNAECQYNKLINGIQWGNINDCTCDNQLQALQEKPNLVHHDPRNRQCAKNNTMCLVYHADGVCPDAGNIGSCTCEKQQQAPEDWEKEVNDITDGKIPPPFASPQEKHRELLKCFHEGGFDCYGACSYAREEQQQLQDDRRAGVEGLPPQEPTPTSVTGDEWTEETKRISDAWWNYWNYQGTPDRDLIQKWWFKQLSAQRTHKKQALLGKLDESRATGQNCARGEDWKEGYRFANRHAKLIINEELA